MTATLINLLVPGGAQHSKIFPHMCEDGRYPSDFQTPMTVELMRVLDSKREDFLSSHLNLSKLSYLQCP